MIKANGPVPEVEVKVNCPVPPVQTAFPVKLPCGNGFIVMVPFAPVIPEVRMQEFASIIELTVYTAVTVGLGMALNGVPLITPA